jgi:hypothetical protein
LHREHSPDLPRYLAFDRKPLACHRSRLRLANSKLHFDLNRRHIVDSPLCDRCGVAETAQHLLGNCTRYALNRARCTNRLASIHVPFSADICLGLLPDNLPDDSISQVFSITGTFIMAAQRLRRF